VDIAWQDGKLTSATIHSDTGEPCSVSYGGKAVYFRVKKGKSITLNGGLDLNWDLIIPIETVLHATGGFVVKLCIKLSINGSESLVTS
jgi:hypothetical protein